MDELEAPKPGRPGPNGGWLAPPYGSPGKPGGGPGKPSKAERYGEQITKAQDLAAANLVDVMAAAIEIARGNAVEHLVNHKTGMIHEIPVNPATRLKAQALVIDRIMGKPEQTKTHELGDGVKGLFQVLLGPAAEAHHGQQAIDAPFTPLLESDIAE